MVRLPTHYHLLVLSSELKELLHGLALLHGRTSYVWKGQESTRGRKVWCNYIDREIRSDRHFWTTLNYIHANPVAHQYVGQCQDWPWSSAASFVEEVGLEKVRALWRKYPVAIQVPVEVPDDGLGDAGSGESKHAKA